MRLLELIRTIEGVAAAQPSVNSLVRDNVFLLNENPAVRYGAFAWVQGQHGESIGTEFRTYRFTFFYVDRLTESRGNAVECQSVGMDTLGNIIRELADTFAIDEWSIDTFADYKRDNFSDMTAGAFASVTMRVPVGGCWEAFSTRSAGDYGYDYNEDYLTYREKKLQILK